MKVLGCPSGLQRCGKRGAHGVDGAGVRLVTKGLLILISGPILVQTLLQNSGCIFIFGGARGASVED